jgi:nucleotide-binding universal stress UspA family protein
MRSDPQKSESAIHSLSDKEQFISFKRIIVGYDDAETSGQVVIVADLIAKEFGSDLIVVNSLPPTPSVLGVVGQPAEDIPIRVAEVKSHIEKDLKYLGVSSQFRVLVDLDDPVSWLRRSAAEHAADLIIVGTRGRYGIKQFLLGSISQSIVGRVDCPILILGPEFTPKTNLFQTILFATDLKETGIGAAQFAGQLADEFNSDLILMHVMPDKPHAEGRMREWIEDNTSDKLNSLISPEAREECNHHTLVAYGDPGQEVLAAADLKRADLIILGARRPHALDDHASWSTLTQVLAQARCPVLIVSS